MADPEAGAVRAAASAVARALLATIHIPIERVPIEQVFVTLAARGRSAL